MKTQPSPARNRVLLTTLLMTCGILTASAQPVLVGKIGARALTPHDLVTYGLPSNSQISGGLFTVGLGQPVYLEVEILGTVPASNVLNVAWSLVSRPLGSAALLTASPIRPDIPIYNPGDRGFYQVAGERRMLRPDLAGSYSVRAQVDLTSGSLVLTQKVTGATYLGNRNSCLFCHSGGYLPDKFGPWSQTLHAHALTNNIDGWTTGHFSQNCIKCHSVGYDTDPLAVNDGFDDVQALTGWVLPGELTNGNFSAMPAALRDKANVQCENCHGPGSEHAFGLGATNRISVSLSAGDCAQCHAAAPYHVKGVEWANSLHAVSTRTPTGENRESCVRCHGTHGFIDYVDGVPVADRRTDYEAITCAACHDPHGEGNPHMLRRVGPVTLMDNITTVTNGGLGQLCMNCHIARQDAVNYVETTTGNSRFGPHYGPQTDMLAGANAITYGKEIPSSAHGTAVANTCVACHLQEISASDPAFGKVGGHTFVNHWDGGTPGNTADDVSLVGLCSGCHGPIESFDFKRADYDGDGVIEGVQTEVTRLMARLATLLPPIGSPTISINSSYTKPQLKAAYNHEFVREDGSYGVHNLAYAVGLLRASIDDLTDDADHDGLSDTWERLHFGTITAYDGLGDPDEDGVINSLELSAGTSPALKDTDMDGVSDLAELEAGSDPTNGADLPGLVVRIYNAAEVVFASHEGKTYQMQRVSELTGAWIDVGGVITGTGENISLLTPTRTGPAQSYFRVIELP